VAAGLAALPASIAWVAVHDAARCLVASEDVAEVIRCAQQAGGGGAAILAQPARDTIKRVRAGYIRETPPRDECWVAQTPQVFRVELLREALAKAEAEGVLGTDDAQLVERLGVEVRVVESHSPNWKITGPEDLANAERWLDRGAGSSAGG
jgi:2-C-methyl-D-erythritol 4-phosphate cytidylyltransferase